MITKIRNTTSFVALILFTQGQRSVFKSGGRLKRALSEKGAPIIKGKSQSEHMPFLDFGLYLFIVMIAITLPGMPSLIKRYHGNHGKTMVKPWYHHGTCGTRL